MESEFLKNEVDDEANLRTFSQFPLAGDDLHKNVAGNLWHLRIQKRFHDSGEHGTQGEPDVCSDKNTVQFRRQFERHIEEAQWHIRNRYRKSSRLREETTCDVGQSEYNPSGEPLRCQTKEIPFADTTPNTDPEKPWG